ncbi:SHOCT domain-containing protein [Hymenobacter sp. ASUV-10]|uniref:SHOCT domain-containing protein n=1 Tax=Hymenobacter aranciens TaxID=3063996 RepID=A0ABT9BCM8_9BACT|nr:SHOCT domain-containing protein [Hymenobacter sp. ASUV-10]MDO7875454.1 SHOCT domain-containing protein [Hymenobacter sp. ASUV-10]
MNNQPSPIETLRQLREMLDAGTITATEFEALKQQLVFSAQAPAAPAAEPPAPDFTAPAVALPAPAEQDSPMFEDAQLPPGSTDLEAPLPAAPTAAPQAVPPAATNELDGFSQPPARNPLNLVLAIGGLLVLLSVFAYLALNQNDSEHISSNSMTAADSLNTNVEEGPQAAPVEQPVAVPETVRVAPLNPAPPVVKPSVAPATADSTATVPTAVDSTQKP